jgi:hypothetical protein
MGTASNPIIHPLTTGRAAAYSARPNKRSVSF